MLSPKIVKPRRLLIATISFMIATVVYPNIELQADSVVSTMIHTIVDDSFSKIDEGISAAEKQTSENKPTTNSIDTLSSKPSVSKTKLKEKEIVYTPIDIQEILADYEQKKAHFTPHEIEHRFLQTNPLFIDLVFHGYADKPFRMPQVKVKDAFKTEFKPDLIKDIPFITKLKEQEVLHDLRAKTSRQLAADAPYLIAFYAHELPDVSDLINFQLKVKPIEDVKLMHRDKYSYDKSKIVIEKIKPILWNMKSNALLQFSQSYISSNWHKGGSDYISILGIINGTFNYDNKKNLQWDNFGEWRTGFNSVEGDTIRLLNTNDDIIRATSKLGIKAKGKWFYSASADFSTQLFNSYTGINSTTLKVKFLTPVKFNAGIGMDYKHKKIFSVMVSPLSYKFVYANDTTNINQKTFGILPGKKSLHQLGSSLTSQLSYSPVRNLQVDSKLYVYTNYEKFEIDWEIVGNFRFNRYLSSRISLNPRYDNTVFLATGEKAKIQFKELLTFGLSYKIL